MTVTTPQVLFYIFSVLAIASALQVIFLKNPVHAVLFLVVTFFMMGGVWLLLEAEFLAITLVLIYVGAVMVLFLFVVMMLDIDLTALRSGFTRYLPLGLCVSVLVVVGLVYSVGSSIFGVEKLPEPMSHPASYSDVKHVGELLYTQYIYPFELAGILLLTAIVAAISLSYRGHRAKKTPLPSKQVSVRKEDRLQVVSISKTSSLSVKDQKDKP